MTYRPEDKAPVQVQFEDLTPGYAAEFSHTLTQQDVDTFAGLTGDFNPIHMDSEFARATSFGKPVVHGMLTSAFISTMVGMLLPGRGALWTSQTLDFVHPSFVGDRVTVRAEVSRVSAATRTMIADVVITNQNGATVVSGQSTVRLLDDGSDGNGGKTAVKIPKHEIDAAETSAEAKAGNTGVILVTGASGGIGQATARALAADGHLVACHYNQAAEAAHELVAQIETATGRAIAVCADVVDPIAVDGMFQEIETSLGPVTGLVHCAAPQPRPKDFGDITWNDFNAHYQVQIGGAFHCVQKAMPAMIMQEKGGAIVFLGSIFGDSLPPPQQPAYVAAKSALAGFARSLAVEFGPKGVRINTVAPGMTNTPMIAGLPEKAKMLTKMNTPLRRLAEPEDIARVVSFLMSEGARHITGETIHVSGGVSMG